MEMAAGRGLEMTGASDEKPSDERGPGWGLDRLSGKGKSCGGDRAEAASIFLHEGDIDRGATKRMACQNK